jgi:hypothetical protein
MCYHDNRSTNGESPCAWRQRADGSDVDIFPPAESIVSRNVLTGCISLCGKVYTIVALDVFIARFPCMVPHRAVLRMPSCECG